MSSVTESYERVRAAQIASVGGAFLRVRPIVSGLAGLLNVVLLAGSEAPVAQRWALGGATAVLIASFGAEALALARRDPGERWLAISLTLTVLALGLACALSGGASSPMLPILFAPIAIALAAFGRTWPAAIVVACAAIVLAVIVLTTAFALMPAFDPIPMPARSWMTLVSAAASVALVTVGVSGLAEAHRRAGAALDRARAQLVEDAIAHAELVESTGLRIAHEIRTPLTSIKALVTLVSESPDAARTGKRLEVVRGEIDRMEALVSDYLALARPLEAGARAPVRIDEQLAELAEVMEGRARARGVTIALVTLPVTIECDARRVREALLNLGVNAIDAMDAGGTLTLSVREDGELARIEVRDTGRGLDEDAIAAMGTPFASGKPGGTGLGVVLARSVAAQHGGSLRFESERGRGTSAILSLPRAAPPEDR
jgi:signal transduction histidine kinase